MLYLSTIAAIVTASALTTQEAAAAGALVGVALSTILTFYLIWFVLQVIADWKIFTKAGQAGWKSLIPFYNQYVEYGICWKSSIGLIYALSIFIVSWINNSQNISNGMLVLAGVLGILSLVLTIIEAQKLSKAFGKGTGFGILLFLFGPILRMVLGFGSARYVGNQSI